MPPRRAPNHFAEHYIVRSTDSRILSNRAEVERQARQREQEGGLGGFERLIIEKTIQEDPLLSLGRELGATITPIAPRLPAQEQIEQTTRLDSLIESIPATVPPVSESVNTPATVERSECHLPTDFELTRLAIADGEASEIRLWMFARAFSDGSGHIEKTLLFNHLKRLKIISSKSTFDAILARGRWVYWTTAPGTNEHSQTALYVYLTGYKSLARKLTQRTLKNHAERVETNRPGTHFYYVDWSGNIQDVEARIYAGWIAQKAAENGFIRISRARLHQLWNRSTRQHIRWEKRAGMRVEACYAEHHNINNPLIPGYAYLCLEEDGKTVFASWRTDNRYSVPQLPEEYPHKGQRRKARTAVNQLMDDSQPVYEHADGQHEKTGRTHFFDKQNGKRSIFGFKALRRHLKKHQDTFTRRHYIRRGQRYGKHIEELSTGDFYRNLDTRRDYKGEQSPAFRDLAMFWRLGWSNRNA